MSTANDCAVMYGELMKMLRLKVTPLGVKLFEKEADIANIPKCRTLKPNEYFTPCQLFGQAMSMGRTMAMTKNHIPLLNCEGIAGMCPQTEEWHGAFWSELSSASNFSFTVPYISSFVN